MIIFTIISAVVAIVAFYFQWTYFRENLNKLEDARAFFLPENNYKLIGKEGSNAKYIDRNLNNQRLQTLVDELNNYIEHNEGTTDFSVIQNKAERYSTSIFEGASSNLAFPTYIGLMGTFCGVFLGLVGFEWNDLLAYFGVNSINDDGDNISRLVQGVIVSMLTSLCGLVLTTISNYKATEYKKDMDLRKNLFYDFIQNELMPSLGTSVVAALNDLKETLGHFHESFDIITDHFEKTFNECTSRFGDRFKENIDAISTATSQLGNSITAVNENVERQKELLKELRSNGMMESMDKFIAAGRQFETATNAMGELNNVRAMLINSTQSLVNTQSEYMSSLVVPKLIAEKLNVILNRVSTFEDSVNKLGENLDATQMIGNSEINMINEHLDIIRRKNALAQEYLDTSDEKLRELYAEQISTIEELNRKYANAIAEHMDEFYDMVNKVSDEIEKKRDIFVEKLDDAFDISRIDSQFNNLNHLPAIEKGIKEIQGLVVDKKELIDSVKDVSLQVRAVSTTLSDNQKSSDELVRDVNTNVGKVVSHIDTVCSLVKEHVEDVKILKQDEAQNHTAIIGSLKEQATALQNLRNGEDALEVSVSSGMKNVIDVMTSIQHDVGESIPRVLEDKLSCVEKEVKAIKGKAEEFIEFSQQVEHVSVAQIKELHKELKAEITDSVIKKKGYAVTKETDKRRKNTTSQNTATEANQNGKWNSNPKNNNS